MHAHAAPGKPPCATPLLPVMGGMGQSYGGARCWAPNAPTTTHCVCGFQPLQVRAHARARAGQPETVELHLASPSPAMHGTVSTIRGDLETNAVAERVWEQKLRGRHPTGLHRGTLCWMVQQWLIPTC